MKQNKEDFRNKQISFKRQFFGGVNEKDVLEKMKFFQEEYDKLLQEEKERSRLQLETQEIVIRKMYTENTLLKKEIELLENNEKITKE